MDTDLPQLNNIDSSRHELYIPRRHGPKLIDFCNHLDAFLKDRFNYKATCVFCGGFGLSAEAKRKKFDIYILVFEEADDFWGGKAIVISRMGFDKTRQGHGSALLKFITDFASEHQFDVIGLEQASSPSIQPFADKYGFQRMGDTNHYTSSVKELGLRLSS